MKNSLKTSILMVVAIMSISNASAIIRTWTGATNTAWATTTNWSGNTLPTANDTVVIPGSLTNYPAIISSTGAITVKRIVMSGDLSNVNKSLTVSGSMVINAGTYSANANFTCPNLTINGGTIITGGSCAFNISSYLLLNSGTLNASTVNSITIVDADLNGGTFTCNGSKVSATFFSGAVAVDGSSFILSSGGGDLSTSTAGTFEFISGTINMNNQTLSILGKYSYTGGTYSNVKTLAVGVYNFNNAGTFVLGYKLLIRDTLNFISGKIQSSGSNIISFNANAYANGADNSKHIIGPVCKAVSSSSFPPFTFPIGDGTYYAPLTISNYGTRNSGDSFTAQYFKTLSPNANSTLGTGISVVSKQEYWSLNRTSSNAGALTTALVTLNYNTNRSGFINDATLLKVTRWDGSQWVDLGRGAGSSTSNTSGDLITTANVSAFTTFTLGSSSSINPLPVRLLNFTAAPISANIDVKWTTTSEINNDFFNVEKSLDGKNWTVIGQVKGAGNSEALTNYNFVDANPVTGIQYYRLKQTDINGQFTYSSIAPVKFSAAFSSQLNIFPMPASNFINVELPGASEMKVSIYNSNGQIVFESTSGSLLNIDIQNLNTGLYIVEVISDNNIISSKFLKN